MSSWSEASIETPILWHHTIRENSLIYRINWRGVTLNLVQVSQLAFRKNATNEILEPPQSRCYPRLVGYSCKVHKLRVFGLIQQEKRSVSPEFFYPVDWVVKHWVKHLLGETLKSNAWFKSAQCCLLINLLASANKILNDHTFAQLFYSKAL